MDQSGRQRQRRAGDVTAAHIEQPGNRGRCGDHGRVCTATLDGDADPLALGAVLFAGKLDRVRDNVGLGRGRTVGPGDVDRVLLNRDQFDTGPHGSRFKQVERGRAVQAGVIADLLALAAMLLDPAIQALADQIALVEQRGVGLLAPLGGIAAIDQQCGTVGHDNRGTGRAGKAGRPQEPLIAVRQVFIVVLILVRDEEAVQAKRGKRGAQLGQVLAAIMRAALNVESLGNHLGHGRKVCPSRERFNACVRGGDRGAADSVAGI